MSSSSLAANSADIAVRVDQLSKCHYIYPSPRDRLKQFVLPRLRRLGGLAPREYYREFWALRDLSLDIRMGESVGIIGRNGSGKSTLLQIICGTLAPTTGSVSTHGRLAALLELGSGFNPEFSGRDNVYMNAAVLGLSREEVDERYADIAAFAGIGDFIERPVKTYSSGMMVRLAFAVSVCVDPDILVVDEALAVGDAAFQFKCLDRLQALTARGTTLLMVSHDMGMLKNFCNYGIYLAHGQERARGAPDELAELYFMDIRDEQREQSDGVRVVPKAFVGDGPGSAFGTDEGQIVAARFAPSGGAFSSFMAGEDVRIAIEVRYREQVDHPHLSILMHDRRMIGLGGNYCALAGAPDGDGWRRARVEATFAARLAPGRYFLTLRLENRVSRSHFSPIDKQVGALSLEVLGGQPDVIAPLDFGMQFSPA